MLLGLKHVVISERCRYVGFLSFDFLHFLIQSFFPSQLRLSDPPETGTLSFYNKNLTLRQIFVAAPVFISAFQVAAHLLLPGTLVPNQFSYSMSIYFRHEQIEPDCCRYLFFGHLSRENSGGWKNPNMPSVSLVLAVLISKKHFPEPTVNLRSKPTIPWIFNGLVLANSMRAQALLWRHKIRRKHYKTSIKLAKKGPQ